MKIPDYCFLRHGETAYNLAGMLHGHLDSKLTELGVWQAAQQGRALQQLRLPSNTLIYSSPLGRAVATAEIIKTYCPFSIKIDENLSEVMMGKWQGKTWNEIAMDLPESLSKDITKFELSLLAPRGEALAELQLRAKSFLSKVSNPAIIVSHGVMLNILRGEICNLSFFEMSHLSQKQGEVFLIKNGAEFSLG
jgi:glucosyl-3-phosphoglycerate phosphatase